MKKRKYKKLNATKVIAMRETYRLSPWQWGEQRLADRFETSVSNVHAVLTRKTWKHI